MADRSAGEPDERQRLETTGGDDCGAVVSVKTYRVTHGRHCTCSACAREDWTRITAPCGMHGPDCPAVYAPIVPDVCHVYMVASKEIAADWPKGDCFVCGLPLRGHEKRVSALAPPGTGYVIDEAMLLPFTQTTAKRSSPPAPDSSGCPRGGARGVRGASR